MASAYDFAAKCYKCEHGWVIFRFLDNVRDDFDATATCKCLGLKPAIVDAKLIEAGMRTLQTP
jgi:hypothetical protein